MGKYSTSEIFDIAASKKAFEEWNNPDEDSDYVSHIKKSVRIAIDEELTDRMKQVYILYHFDGVSIPKIAAMLGVNKSTVSRTIKRANARLAKVLRYSAPHLLYAEYAKRNRRINHVQ